MLSNFPNLEPCLS